MRKRLSVAILAVVLAAVGDLAGFVHQLTSTDRPPAPAMVIGLVAGVVGLAAALALRDGRSWGLPAGLASRVVDVVLLVGAAAAGKVFDESAGHAVPAAVQLVLSAVAAVFLISVRSAATASDR